MNTKLKERIKKMKKKGFTLIELIVVIAVLGVLVLLAAPKFLGYTTEAKLVQIKSDIRAYESQIGAKLIKDKDYLQGSNFQPVQTTDLENLVASDELFNAKGEVDDNYVLDETYVKVLDDLINTDLPGDFFVSDDGDVYYHHQGGLNLGNNGGTTPGGNTGGTTPGGNTGGTTPGGNTGGTTPPVQPEDPNGDNDLDGFTNAEEDAAGTDKNDPNSFPKPPEDPNGDNDLDGFTNAEEDAAGTDKNDPLDFPSIKNIFAADLINLDTSYYVIDDQGNVYARDTGTNAQYTNPNGALGIGKTGVALEFEKVKLNVPVVNVFGGADAAYFLGADNVLYSAGAERFTKFPSVGSNTPVTTPVPVFASGVTIKEIKDGFVLTSQNVLYRMPFNRGHSQETGDPNSTSTVGPITQIATGVDSIVSLNAGFSGLGVIKNIDGTYSTSGFANNGASSGAAFTKNSALNSLRAGAEGLGTFSEVYGENWSFLLNDDGTITGLKTANSVAGVTVVHDIVTNVKSMTALNDYSSGYLKSAIVVKNDGAVGYFGGGNTLFGSTGNKVSFTEIPTLTGQGVTEVLTAYNNLIIVKKNDGKKYYIGGNTALGLPTVSTLTELPKMPVKVK